MKDLPTPGGVTRRLVADMLLNAKLWTVEHSEAVMKTAKGEVVRVCGETGIVTFDVPPDCEAGHKPHKHNGATCCIRMVPGPFRAWRLKNAVRRLAAARISKVLP